MVPTTKYHILQSGIKHLLETLANKGIEKTSWVYHLHLHFRLHLGSSVMQYVNQKKNSQSHKALIPTNHE